MTLRTAEEEGRERDTSLSLCLPKMPGLPKMLLLKYDSEGLCSKARVGDTRRDRRSAESQPRPGEILEDSAQVYNLNAMSKSLTTYRIYIVGMQRCLNS
jgi:hypothetical protein